MNEKTENSLNYSLKMQMNGFIKWIKWMKWIKLKSEFESANYVKRNGHGVNIEQ